MDDLISRQALCEYALNQKDNSVTPNDIMRFPSAQPEPKWISVTKELPKENGEYMVTVEYLGWHGEKGRMLTSTRYTKTKGWSISNGKVTAWMPLPELYWVGGECE